MKKEFLEAFSRVVCEQVISQRDVELEGIGVFRSEHQKQYQQQYQDGRVVMMPPIDSIKFVSDKR